MVELLGSTFDPQAHDGAMLLRFLKARGFEPPRAVAMMKARLDWERKVNPKGITLDMVRSEATKKKGFFHCYDKGGRPCVVVKAGSHSPKTSDADIMLKLVIFVLEKAIEWYVE